MSRMDRPTFEQTFFAVAEAVARRADCTRLQVGAVITVGNRIWATGYNGPPASGQPGCLQGACPRGRFSYEELPGYRQGNQDHSDCISIHAEINAMDQFDAIRRSVRQSRFVDVTFLWITHEPCHACRLSMQQQGIVPRWRGDAREIIDAKIGRLLNED